MLLDTLPRHGPVPDPGTGEERRVAVALVLMDDPADDGLTTGWYWTEVPNEPKPEDLKSKRRWRDAAAAGQGPVRDAAAAFAAAENHTREGRALAARLAQAAALLRAGEIEASASAIAKWLTAEGATPVGPPPDAGQPADDRTETDRILTTGVVPDDEDDDGGGSDGEHLRTRTGSGGEEAPPAA